MNGQLHNPSDAILQRIIYHVETLQATGTSSRSAPQYDYPPGLQAKNRAQHQEDNPLKTLRLVNKNFAKAAGPAVFKDIAFFPSPASRCSQKLADMRTLMGILNKDIASHVRKLVIRPQLCDSTHKLWLQCTQFTSALPICFEKLHNLQTVSLDGGVFIGLDWKSHYVTTSNLPTSLGRSFVKALHNTFMSASSNVTGFELDFPIMEGLFQYFSPPNIAILCAQALSNLDHLSVTIPYLHREHACFTATSTSHPLQQYATAFPAPHHGAATTSLPPQQHAITSLPPQHQNYPAPQHEGRFWTLLNLASNLRSLRIHCGTILNLENIRLENLQRLEVLDIARMRCHAEHLLAICSPSQASLRALRLYEIRLVDGTWAKVFLFLKGIQTLLEFEAMALTYDMPSHHFARILHPFDPHLEMPRPGDPDAFQELTSSVLQRQQTSGFAFSRH